MKRPPENSNTSPRTARTRLTTRSARVARRFGPLFKRAWLMMSIQMLFYRSIPDDPLTLAAARRNHRVNRHDPVHDPSGDHGVSDREAHRQRGLDGLPRQAFMFGFRRKRTPHPASSKLRREEDPDSHVSELSRVNGRFSYLLLTGALVHCAGYPGRRRDDAVYVGRFHSIATRRPAPYIAGPGRSVHPAGIV